VDVDMVFQQKREVFLQKYVEKFSKTIKVLFSTECEYI